jgi:hypothetical protein
MLTIHQALARIKGNLERYVPDSLIQRLADDHHVGQRRRTLTPLVTTHLFLKQILQGNTPAGHLIRISHLDFTEAAYCRARARLSFGFLLDLQNQVTGRCFRAEPLGPEERWHGHDVSMVDGSSFSMPDTDELRTEFGQPSGQAPGCGFPTAHLLVCCQARSGYIRKVLAAPHRTHDRARVALMHPALTANAVIVGDRAFCSYAHLALCRQRRLQGLFRAHQKTIIDFRPGRPYAPAGMSGRAAKGLPRSRFVRRLGKYDQVVEYFKPQERPEWMTAAQYAALPASLQVRECRYTIRVPGRRPREVTLVTTLLDRRRYSRKALAELYGLRWTVETNLRHLKETLGMGVLRCQSCVGVMKELMMFITVYNLVRRVMREAGRRQGVEAERISFVDALRWLQEARVGDELPRLRVVPERPGRAEPRARKRRPKSYPLLTRSRKELIQELMQQQPAA